MPAHNIDIRKRATECCPYGSYAHQFTDSCCEMVDTGMRELVEDLNKENKVTKEPIEVIITKPHDPKFRLFGKAEIISTGIVLSIKDYGERLLAKDIEEGMVVRAESK